MEEEGQAKQSALLETMRSKFTPRTVLHVAQLVVIIALIVSTQNNQWTNINADFEYVEGVPAGVGMEANVNISEEKTTNQIHLKGFFTLRKWNDIRNDTTIESNESVQEEESDFKMYEFSTLEEVREEVSILNYLTISLLSILFILHLFDIRYRSLLGIVITLLVFWIFISLAVRAPLGYIASADFESDVNEERNEKESNVHSVSTFDYSFNDTSINLFFTTSSYDLGLVNESNLTEVIETPPGEDHPSFIKMEGKVSLTIGKFISDLFYMWIALFVLIPTVLNLSKWLRIDKPVFIYTSIAFTSEEE